MGVARCVDIDRRMDVIDLDTVNPQPMGGRSDHGWTPVPQFRVDVKSYGMTKHQPAIVLATCGDQLLLQLVAVDGDCVSPLWTCAIPREWWSVKPGGLVSVSMDQTRQGYRFTRTITKLVKLLGRLGREAARKRATAQQLAERAAARVGRDGECQICTNRQIVQKELLVLHGYERPGHGSVNGECYGRGYPPYEVSCDRLRWYIEIFLAGELERVRAARHELPSLPQLSRQIYVGQEFGRAKYRTEWVKRGALGFSQLEDAERRNLELRINSLEFEIQRQGLRLAAWRPT